jgi:uroporphyrinogen-III decarboxylase
MTPSERLYVAVSGGVPDRVPVVPKIWVDLAANLTGTSFVDILEDPLLALRVLVDAGELVGADAVRQFPFPERRIARDGDALVEVDAHGRRRGGIDIDGGWATHLDNPGEFDFEDPYTMAYHTSWACFGEPYVKTVEEAHRIAVPSRTFYDQQGWGDRQRQVQAEVGDRMALIGDLNSATIAFLVTLRGLQTAMLDLVDNPRLVHAILEKGAEIAIERGRYVVDLGHKVLRLNDSVGNMSLISPESWREFVFPHMKTVCDEIHRYDPSVRIYCHICGNVTPILEDLVEAGLDCIAPLDPLGQMEPGAAREVVGDRISLMGGVDTLAFIQAGPEQIEEQARTCIRGGGEEGGYVLGSGCVVPRAAPRENLQVLRRAAERYGRYAGGRLVDAPGG